MLNKISYLSKSASFILAIFFVGLVQEDKKTGHASPGPHFPDAIKLSNF